MRFTNEISFFTTKILFFQLLSRFFVSSVNEAEIVLCRRGTVEDNSKCWLRNSC